MLGSVDQVRSRDARQNPPAGIGSRAALAEIRHVRDAVQKGSSRAGRSRR